MNSQLRLFSIAKRVLWPFHKAAPSPAEVMAQFFDVDFYLREQPHLRETGQDPIQHYLEVGAREGQNPHPLFETQWYLETYADVASANINPLLHFLNDGRREGRCPNRLFDPRWYLAQYADINAGGIDPLQHFIEAGAREGRDPHPLFDTRWYIETNPDVAAAGLNPLVHYLADGRREGRAPHPGAALPAPEERSRHPVPEASPLDLGAPPFLASESVLVPADRRSRRPLVVLLSHDCSLTGAPMVVLNLAEHLVAAGAVDVVVFSKGGGLLTERFMALPDFRFISPDPTTMLDAELAPFAGRPVKVALCNTVLTSDFLAPLKRHGFRVVSLVHEMAAVIEQVGRVTLERIDASADAVVFGSAFVRDAVVEAYAPTNPNLFIVPTGNSVPDLSPQDVVDCRARLRAATGFPRDSIVVLGCGTIDHRKGVDVFIQTARRVRQSGEGGDIRFVWIGGATEPYLTYCRDDIAKLGLGKHICFLEPKSDLFAYMPGADLFVLTSREDPFPLVNLAAMACGIPPILFRDAGGASDAVADQAGIVVPYLDINAMAEAIVSLAQDGARRSAIGTQAAARYCEHYTQEAFCRNLSAVLTRIGLPIDLDGRASRSPARIAGPRLGRANDQVSVVIPSYNHARYIERAIRSVLDQDHPVLELIIIDDCSKDRSDALIRPIVDAYSGPVKIRYEALKTNGGAHAAIMRGLSLARGEVLSILNSDDYYATDRFSTVLAQAPAQGDFIAFSAVDFIDGDGARMGADSGIRGWYRKALSDALECPTVGFALLRNNIAVTSGNIVFTRDLYRKVGGFARYRMCHDWDFLMRATHYVEPIFVQAVGMAYRVHETNTLNETRHLLEAEGVPALNTFVELTRHAPSPNALAPSARNWPMFFDYFIDRYPSWFAPEPMRQFIRHAAAPAPVLTGAWEFAGRTPAADLGIFTQACRDQDALALRRAMALAARPFSNAGFGFARAIETQPVEKRAVETVPVAPVTASA